MSRFSYDGEEWFPNQGALWHANAARALRGKKGRKSLEELREALLALPEKRLIYGALCTVGGEKRAPEDAWGRQDLEYKLSQTGEGVCAVGAYIWYKKVKAGMDPQAAFDELPTYLDADGGDSETAYAGMRAGLTLTLAYTLGIQNDVEYEGLTPEERYEQFLGWIDGVLALPAT